MKSISTNGIELIKEYEGFRSKAYQDIAGIWTIGYGTTKIDGKNVDPSLKCTKAEATVWLLADLEPTERMISIGLPNLNQNQFDALCSLAYNIGNGALSRSTLWKTLKSGFPANEFMFTAWSKARVGGELKIIPGLLRRRRAEWRLFKGAQ